MTASVREVAIVGDGRSAATVSADGELEWEGRRLAVAPVEAYRSQQYYADDSNLLVTAFDTAAGRLSVIDAMAVSSEQERLERRLPEHLILRRLSCERGSVEVELRYRAGGAGDALAGRLHGERPAAVGPDGVEVARFTLRQGEAARFALSWDGGEPASDPPLGEAADEVLRRSDRWWRAFSERCAYRGPFVAEVRRSLLALKLLSHTTSGAVGDDGTTERSPWLRDAALTMRALLDLGYRDDAEALCAWLLHAASLSPPDGLQLDVYGEVIDAVARLARGGVPLERPTGQLLVELGEKVCRSWRSADHGLWGPAGPPEPHTLSRVLCWVALDRLLDLGQRGLIAGVPIRFADERERIRREVESRGFSPAQVSYTHVLDGRAVDASLVLLGWYGYVQPRSPRMRSTFEQIRRRLSAGPALLRRSEEAEAGPAGERGDACGPCSFWAAEHLARGGGELQEAEAWFKRLLGHATGAGLFAGWMDGETGAPRGDLPQAFTHIALLGAALAIEERRRGAVGGEAAAARSPSEVAG